MISCHAERLRSILLGSNPALIELERRYPLNEVAAEIDEIDPFLGYRAIPARVSSIVSDIEMQFSKGMSSDYLCLLLAHFIDGFDVRFKRNGFSEEFRKGFEKIIRRIVDSIESEELRFGASLGSDLFMKDLGVARQVLIPCASHLIYRHSGVPRRVFLKQRGVRQRVQLLKALLFHTHGFRPFMENHVHLKMLDEFDANGRERCFGLVAELLRSFPDSLGLIGTSWYYDPNLREVTPALGYLHSGPARKGALFIDLGESEQARIDAGARSPRRRILIEQGIYRPKMTMLIWGRRDILAHY